MLVDVQKVYGGMEKIVLQEIFALAWLATYRKLLITFPFNSFNFYASCRYAVGTVYETEDCSQCICKIGGVPYCTPKVCEKCEKGLRSVVTSTCGCVCQPCDEGTILCPTSNVCINATLWCNKIQDCPDDELNCITTTPEPETTTLEISEKRNLIYIYLFTYTLLAYIY